MIKRRSSAIFMVTLAFGAMGMLITTVLAEEVPRITKEELKEIMASPDVVIVDMRVGKDWTASEFKIEGAVRGDPSDLGSWMSQHSKEKTLVFYCA